MRSKLTNCFLSFKYWSYWFTGCTDDRKVGEKWERIKSMTGQNEGICSLCECLADGEEFCQDSRFICFDISGCLETEIKPDFCCPQCSKYYQRDDNEINAWNKRKRGRKMSHSKKLLNNHYMFKLEHRKFTTAQKRHPFSKLGELIEARKWSI